MYLRLTELFETELFICIEMDLAFNNLQRLICHKTKGNQNKTNKPNDVTFGLKDVYGWNITNSNEISSNFAINIRRISDWSKNIVRMRV